MAGMDLRSRSIREQMASALDLIVHLSRLRDGTRPRTHISEVMGMEGDVIVLQDLYLYDYSMGIDATGPGSSASSRAPGSDPGSPNGSPTTA